MTLSKIGRAAMAVVATFSLGLGMTACGGGTIGYMWVLGTYYNQISGFLIDDYTGNLTAITHSPFSSGGTNPVSLLVKPGGRFLFVINAGSGATGTPGTAGFNSPGQEIAVFSVGGGGTLTFEQSYVSQGVQSVWASLDTSGNYLYVVDKYSPDYAVTGNGSITAYQIAGDTGRLTLVPNTAILKNQIPQSYFEVGPGPIMAKIGSGSCLFTLSPNSIYPYQVNSSNGQLTTTITSGSFPIVGSNSLTSINTSQGSSAGSYVYLTDGGGNQIFSLTAGGTACSLSPIAGTGPQQNLSGTLDPVNSLTSSSGKFLYVLNYKSVGGGTQTNSNSTISAFTINSQGQLAPLSDSTNNPYAVGSGPLCISQDPSNQYIYISDYNDSTVTGKLLDQNRGFLSDLSRGTVFPTSMKPSCLVVSGNL
jgi:6-phosphogluconolactonase (cycloisomerase 2 family)